MRVQTIAVGGLLATTYATSVGSSDVFDESFEKLVQELLETNHVPGISIAVIRDGDFTSQGYGFSTLPDTLANGDTLYYTGSTTKAFVATVAAKIVVDNDAWPDVHWHTPISHLLPSDFVLGDEHATAHTTLEDALSHRSGLSSHDASYGWTPDASPVDNVRLMRYLPLTAAPRTRWQYSNVMYNAVGVALEAITKQPLSQLLREWLWQPLGMRSTTWSLREAERQRDADGARRLARGYFWTGEHYVPNPYLDISGVAAAGATISSVNDYALWVRALLSAHAEDTGLRENASSPVDASILRHVTTARSIITGNGVPRNGLATYALGWVIDQAGSHPQIWHNGGLPGFVTFVAMLPHVSLGFVSIENGEGNGTKSVGDLVWAELLARLGLTSSVVGRMEATEHFPAEYESPIDREMESSPGILEDYVGVYFHPGYGHMHVNLSSAPDSTTMSDLREGLQSPFQPTTPEHGDRESWADGKLQVTLSPRLWPWEIELTHVVGATFNTTQYIRHGVKNSTMGGCDSESASQKPKSHPRPSTSPRRLDCRYQTFLEPKFRGKAVFERGLNAAVDRLGIQLEPAMVEAARQGDWRESMVWFMKGHGQQATN